MDLYYKACTVLVSEDDFRDLIYSYLRRASTDNVYVSEILFEPQAHTSRGVPLDVVVSGLHRGILDGHRDFSIRASLMCLCQHFSEAAAISMLEQIKPFSNKIAGVSFENIEVDSSPTKFERVFKKVSELGLKAVIYTGEEGRPNYIREVVDVHHVCQQKDISLTACPLSNKFYGKSESLFSKGLKVTISSVNPAYFGGYISDSMICAIADYDLTEKEIYQLCRNVFNTSFLSDHDKAYYLAELDYFTVSFGYAAPSRSISIFGSRSPQPGNPNYEEARAVSKLLASHGFTVLTGGYNGIMRACSQGAKEGIENSPSLNFSDSSCSKTQVHGILAPSIFLQRDALGNQYLTQHTIARSLTDRIHHLMQKSEYFLVFGGTIGTITELCVVWNAATLRKIYGAAPQRIFLLRSKWEKSLGAFAEAMSVYPEDRELITYVDSGEEFLELVEADMAKRVAAATITLSSS